METKTIILYHRDMDGLASALIAKRIYPDADIFSIQYGEEDLITDKFRGSIYENIILVDFSLPKDTTDILRLSVKNKFIWIDHHKSAKEKMPELWNDKDIKGIRSLKKSACELCCDYFFPDEEIPYGIKLVGDFDTWTFKYGNDTNAFFEYLNLYDIEEDIENLESLLFMNKKGIDECIDDGLKLYQYKMATVKHICKSGVIENWEGHKCFTVYSNCYISNIGNYALETNPEAEIAKIVQKIYDKEKQKWITVIGLRSREKGVDVSKIAMKYKGGGHFSASGFSIE